MERRNDRLSNAVGFAKKAGRLQSGDFVTERLLRAGKAGLILLDEGASDNTVKKYALLCEARGVRLVRVPALGACIGNPSRMVAAVTDENFVNMIANAAGCGDEQDFGGKRLHGKK